MSYIQKKIINWYKVTKKEGKMQGIFQKIIFFLIMIYMNVIFDMFTHFIYDHIISYLDLTPVIKPKVKKGHKGSK